MLLQLLLLMTLLNPSLKCLLWLRQILLMTRPHVINRKKIMLLMTLLLLLVVMLLLVVVLLFEVKPYSVHLLLRRKIKLRIIHRFPHRVRQHGPSFVNNLKRLIGEREPILMRVEDEGEPLVLGGDVVRVLNKPDQLKDPVKIRLLHAIISDDLFLGSDERINNC